MAWFKRRERTPGSYRVTAVNAAPTSVSVITNGAPQQKLHVSGLLSADGIPPQAVAYELRLGLDRTPAVGDVLPADITSREPLRATVQWGRSDQQLRQAAVQGDSETKVLADLLRDGTTQHAPGAGDALGYAATDPDMAPKLAQQLSAAMGTPISMDVDVDGVRRTVHAGGGGHLSSAEAAELLRSGTAATALITGATRVEVPAAMLGGGGEASLWDLALTVTHGDGSTYAATTRTAYRTEARRVALGTAGSTIPVRVDPADDSRVAIDGVTYDATHPDAPPG